MIFTIMYMPEIHFSGELPFLSIQMYVTRGLYPASFAISVLVLDKNVEIYSYTHMVSAD